MNRTKVVFIINNFALGGVERLLCGVLSHLDRSAMDITIITVLGAEGPLRSEFERLGVALKHVGSNENPGSSLWAKAIWSLKVPGLLLGLRSMLMEVNPDVVITSLYQADVLGVVAVKLAGVKRRIFIQHDVEPLNPMRSWLKRVTAVAHASEVVAVSKTVSKYLQEKWAIPKDKIKLIYNGVEFVSTAPSSRENPVIGFIGRMEKVKGPDILIEALSILKEKYDLAPRVKMVGEGSLRKELEKGAPDNVEFTGENKNLHEVLGEIDILVVSSRLEGFGLVVLEGLAANKIVVASDISAFRELIEDGENGVLFPSEKTSELAKTLRDLLNDSKKRGRILSQVKRWIRANGKTFSLRVTATKYQNLIVTAPGE